MRLARLAAAGLVLAAAACSSSKESPKEGPPPIAEPVPDVQGLTSFLQAVPLAEPYYPGQDFELFPGCANVWDLGSDFSLLDGGNDQWDGALELRVGTLATAPATFDSVALEVDTLEPFAPAGGYEALRYATPSLSAAEVPVAVASNGALLDEPPLSGTTTAYLAPTLDSRLQQAIDLRAAVAPLTLALVDRVWLHAYGFGSQPASYRIVVRSPADASVLGTVLDQAGSSSRTARSLDLSAFAGQQIVLSFELRGEPESSANALAAIDDVSITDAAGHELVRNGDFEQGGLSGWTLAGEPGFRQLVSAAVTAGDLQITRSFYTAPRLLWARWVDEFENLGAAAVTRDVVYRSDLGSDGAGIVYATPGTTGALSSWDGSDFRDGADRDVALVHGDGTALFRSSAELTSSCLPVAPATSCGWDGDDRIFVVHRITVPAGGKVSLVHFIVMNGENTGRYATSVGSRAVAVDAVAAAIANGFGQGAGYEDYMTASQVATVANF